MIKQQFSPLVRHGVTYRSLVIGSVAALTLLLSWGVIPRINPITKEFLIPDDALTYRQWNDLLDRHDIVLGLSWQFGTSGATLTLASDFNTASNTINCIGSGAGGTGGTTSFGGNGGGGGAYAAINNYSTHGAGFAVSIQVGTGDTWFDSSSTVLAKGASGQTGGLVASSIGTTKFSGGNGVPGIGCNYAGGGGGAGGPHGAGGTVPGAADGGSGDAGRTAGGIVAAGGNGTQFDATHGSGGGGSGGVSGGTGFAGGSYGGGGGGGAQTCVGSSNGGAGFQGLIAVSYTPVGGAKHFLLGGVGP